MSKQLKVKEPEEYQVIRDLFDPRRELSESQIKLFLYTAKERGLDPRLKQICAVVFAGKMSIITQIDGLRLIAERTKRYAPGKVTEFEIDENGKLVAATAYVKKQTEDGTWHEVAGTAHFDEYNTGKNTWASKPRVMIAKCAEAIALRRAFPGEMSALYAEEELDKEQQYESISTANVQILENQPEEKEIQKLSELQVSQIEDMIGNQTAWLEKELAKGKYKKLQDVPAKNFGTLVEYINNNLPDTGVPF